MKAPGRAILAYAVFVGVAFIHSSSTRPQLDSLIDAIQPVIQSSPEVSKDHQGSAVPPERTGSTIVRATVDRVPQR